MDMDMATMKERKFEESEVQEETNVTHADRNMHDKKEKSDKKLMITRHQVREMDSIKTVVKRHGFVVKAHETPHTPTASPPEESLQLFEKAEPSPTLLQVRSLNRTKLKMSSVQDQDDLTATLAPQRMEKVHKDDSSDYERSPLQIENGREVGEEEEVRGSYGEEEIRGSHGEGGDRRETHS